MKISERGHRFQIDPLLPSIQALEANLLRAAATELTDNLLRVTEDRNPLIFWVSDLLGNLNK